MLSTLLARSVFQQIRNFKDFVALQRTLFALSKDGKIGETLQLAFETEVPVQESKLLQMKISYSEKNPLAEHNFDVETTKTPEEVIKEIMENQPGLPENPTTEQLNEIVYRTEMDQKPLRIGRNLKGKRVYFTLKMLLRRSLKISMI